MSISHELQYWLDRMVQENASDLILTEGQPPTLRRVGDLFPGEGVEKLNSDKIQQLVYGLLTPEQQKSFEQKRELDASFGIDGVARFRLNVFQQRGSMGRSSGCAMSGSGRFLRTTTKSRSDSPGAATSPYSKSATTSSRFAR